MKSRGVREGPWKPGGWELGQPLSKGVMFFAHWDSTMLALCHHYIRSRNWNGKTAPRRDLKEEEREMFSLKLKGVVDTYCSSRMYPTVREVTLSHIITKNNVGRCRVTSFFVTAAPDHIAVSRRVRVSSTPPSMKTRPHFPTIRVFVVQVVFL